MADTTRTSVTCLREQPIGRGDERLALVIGEEIDYFVQRRVVAENAVRRTEERPAAEILLVVPLGHHGCPSLVCAARLRAHRKPGQLLMRWKPTTRALLVPVLLVPLASLGLASSSERAPRGGLLPPPPHHSHMLLLPSGGDGDQPWRLRKQ